MQLQKHSPSVQSSRRSHRVQAFRPAAPSKCASPVPQLFTVGGSAPCTAPRTPCVPQPRHTVVRAAAAPEAPSTSSTPETKQWYALVASAEFYFNDVQNESMAEQLRERVRWYKEQNRERDFHIVPQPKWLEARYPEQAKRVNKPAVALVSTDKQWIIFMKLRLDRVLRIDLPADMPEEEVLAVGGEIPQYNLADKKWTAPYPPYSPGWWNVFVPGKN